MLLVGDCGCGKTYVYRHNDDHYDCGRFGSGDAQHDGNPRLACVSVDGVVNGADIEHEGDKSDQANDVVECRTKDHRTGKDVAGVLQFFREMDLVPGASVPCAVSNGALWIADLRLSRPRYTWQWGQ